MKLKVMPDGSYEVDGSPEEIQKMIDQKLTNGHRKIARPNRDWNKWTKEDDTALLAMHRSGKSPKLIASSLGRTRSSVRSRISRLLKLLDKSKGSL